MNQTCRVCGEPAAGFHFGAFTCEGCKSFFGRSYNNLSSISECKNNGKCIIDKKNRTTCKACRLRKCYTVGMSKGGSRYGRRSNWFKIHCLLQEHQQQALEAAGKAAVVNVNASSLSPNMHNTELQQQQQQQHHLHHAHHHQHQQAQHHHHQHHHHQHQQQQRNNVAAAQLAAAHGFLGAYPGYPHAAAAHQLPIDSASAASPFMSAAAIAAAAAAARHPAAAEAAAFFSMMNSPQSAFQLPPHLLLSAAAAGYHPSAAAAAAAADAAYRAEMYRHRQSVDSAASGDSQRYATSNEQHLPSIASSPSLSRQSPELCVSGDDDVITTNNTTAIETKTQSTPTPTPATKTTTTIHSPIAIRATPLDFKHTSNSPINTNTILSPVGMTSIVPTPTPTPTNSSQPRTPEPTTTTTILQQQIQQQAQKNNNNHHNQQTHTPQPNAEQTALAFAAKMQSLSPVSVCSIGAETSQPMKTITTSLNDQDCPIDLSMKPAMRTNTNNDEAVEDNETHQKTLRRKFYQIHSENECTSSSIASIASMASISSSLHSPTALEISNNNNNNIIQNNNNNNNNESIKNEISAPNLPTTTTTTIMHVTNEHAKRQKLNSVVEATTTTTTASTNYNNFTGSSHGATSLHGIFVCV